jgi:hypothetical protein
VLEIAQRLRVGSGKPASLLMGRHLRDLMEPGPQMGNLLRAAYQAQLDGEFDNVEGAVVWARRWRERVPMRLSCDESTIVVPGKVQLSRTGLEPKPSKTGGHCQQLTYKSR